MENKQRKLPRSKKAMEYRVYWLERKLKHLKVSEHRKANQQHIAAMPNGPVKDLLHLTNEFHQANEQAQGLKTLTEELNQDTLKLNERTERLHEVAAEKLAGVDRTNRQSRRIQERGRKINKESLKTAAVSRAINKQSQDQIEQLGRRLEEAAYLSDLTRAQHEATDALNLQTRNLNEETVKTTANSLKINRHLADTTANAQDLNASAEALQAELEALKSQLESRGEETIALNQTTHDRLAELAESQERIETVAEQAMEYVAQGESQFHESQALNEELKRNSETSIHLSEQAAEQQQAVNREASRLKQELTDLSTDMTETLDNALASSTRQLDENQQEQMATLLGEQKRDFEAFSLHAEEYLANHQQEIQHRLQLSTETLDDYLERTMASIDERDSISAAQLQDHINEFNQNARLRFIAVEERSKRINMDFSQRSEEQLGRFEHQSQEQLERFEHQSQEQLAAIDGLLGTLSQDVTENLEKSERCRASAEQLLDETSQANEETQSLNDQTRSLLERTDLAVNQVDQALEEVTNVSRKMYRETRDLQDKTASINDMAEHHATELKTLNEQSMQIQSDSLQTQALSQEINQHSIDLNQQTQVLQGEFEAVRDTNLNLVHQLQDLKTQLQDLGARSEQQLGLASAATSATEQAKTDYSELSAQTESLNQDIEHTLAQARHMVGQVQSQSQASEALFEKSSGLCLALDDLKTQLEREVETAADATEAANKIAAELKAVGGDLQTTMLSTIEVNQSAQDCIQSMEATALETINLNAETRNVQGEMRQAIAQSRQINDDFMRGLESLSRKAELSEEKNQQLLTETEQIQSEINGILDLKHGIEGFQRAVDAGQEQLKGLIERVDQCQEQSGNHELMVSQYQARMETYQADVTRYRESMIQLEQRFRTIDEQLHAQEVKLEDSEHELNRTVSEQRDQLETLVQELKQKIAFQQSDLDRTKQALREDSEQVIDRVANEIRMDLDHKLEVANRSTQSLMSQTDGEIRLLNSEMQQLNRSLQDEIATLKNETHLVNEQHALLQQEQVQTLNEQRNRSQQQDFEIDTLKKQLENYQRLMETQLDNSPVEQLQQRVKQLENSLRQQQRTLKLQEAENDKPKLDARVRELQQMVEDMNRSMTDLATNNRDLKQCLDETRVNNQRLQKTNRDLELNLSASQSELDLCLQRIHRLESRDASIEEALSGLKTRDNDTQQTLQQMRNAVKDSTLAMRETQRTLETLNTPEPKRDWLSPRQAVVSSVFAVAISCAGFFGFEEVNAAYQTTPQVSQVDSLPLEVNPGGQGFADLSKKLAELQQANASIDELGEFAWPVNFGIVDPADIEYREQHQGISITAELGDPVVAINDGKVIYSNDEIRGYGNMIVIQHEQDLLSVYANNQYNYVSEGDEVKRGQLIGDIGQLFNENTAGLYFEIRRGGTPTDPFSYLRHHAPNHAAVIGAR